jgi:hypothetical protein
MITVKELKEYLELHNIPDHAIIMIEDETNEIPADDIKETPFKNLPAVVIQGELR